MIGPAVLFAGGSTGAWEVTSIESLSGPPLPTVSRLAVWNQTTNAAPASWTLRGWPSNLRYTRRDEQETLTATQAALDRPGATRAWFEYVPEQVSRFEQLVSTLRGVPGSGGCVPHRSAPEAGGAGFVLEMTPARP